MSVANKAPQNLYHFVLDNGVYATTGGQDTPGTNSASYAQLARSAGYAAIFEFDELEDFDDEAEEILRKPGPVMICVKTVPDIRGPRQPSDPVNTEVVQERPQAIDNLLGEFGRS